MVYKMNESIIVIQAEATSPNRTNVVFWSHDRGTAKLRMKLVRKNGIPQSLPEGTTVPIRLMFKSATAEGGYGKHDYLATVEDPVNGIVFIVLEDNILGYVGKVEGSVYIDFPNDRSLDTAGRFTFYIKRSPIDDSTPELEDYYFNGFSQTIDKIEKILADGKQEIDQKIAESEMQIEAKLKDTNDKITKANQDVATLNTNIDKANDRIDQTNQQIGDLGKLKKMYSNSIDFGEYDYSGNPNIAPVINDENVKSLNNTMTTVTGHGTYATAEKIGNDLTIGVGMVPWDRYDFSKLTVGKQYTLTIPIRINADYTGDISKLFIRIRCANTDGGVLVNTKMLPSNTPKEELVDISTTFTVPSTVQNSNNWYCQVGSSGDSDARGTVDIGYDVKLEEGSTATPYQPNLLDAPYYLSKVPLGENIANKSVTFPIKTSAYAVYDYKNVDNFIVGEKYVLTIKATKPATQIFNVRNTPNYTFGVMKPVEGLTNIWVLEFTPTSIDAASPSNLQIYQVPNDTKGACQIDWLKIEKGDTRTPNISQFKYFGEGLKDSNNPNDYSWDVTPEYTEKGLNNTVSLTEPQSVEGLKNFEDGLQIAGKEVATVPEDTGWVNLTAINGHSWNKQGQIRRIGKLVMFRGSLKGSTLSTQDFCTIPEGFRPSNPTDNYEYQFLLPPQSSNTLDNGGMAYIRPNGVCGLPSFRGTVNLFLAPIQYYID
ncbi:TPA: BppU family phage baseplate upper protein [Enterococcus faecium]|uniref:BppU family phage baseplate upper protein n=1 Tax=Enterococcus faecium TaxID=1352 RepID=UPI0019D85088|nr:BppU family phage baseplate upper protein [Enterococcus faecium]EGP5624830.1 BppU family phage baseplate upper protein [Enterococcus faecium]EME7126720.1 BppU family phage baseplate upper protein [Enterococcus faecium]EME8250802.1 BppU family phage baseplate upper protein [Enterococcus faecium]MDK4440897.1 BppU family phage baseplate upper protein [Enterococcus faecium]